MPPDWDDCKEPDAEVPLDAVELGEELHPASETIREIAANREKTFFFIFGNPPFWYYPIF